MGKEKTAVWLAATRLQYIKINESGGAYEKEQGTKIESRKDEYT